MSWLGRTTRNVWFALFVAALHERNKNKPPRPRITLYSFGRGVGRLVRRITRR